MAEKMTPGKPERAKSIFQGFFLSGSTFSVVGTLGGMRELISRDMVLVKIWSRSGSSFQCQVGQKRRSKESQGDDIRYDARYWDIWQIEER